jgi:adenylate kinase
MALNLIILGPPGAGKGTQAAQFAAAHGIPKISTGDMLRDGIKQRLPLALRAKQRMDLGELVDDETMIGIVRERLARPDTEDGFILDGFPRTVHQGRVLDALMEERGRGPLLIVDITVPEEELVLRLAARRICATCGTNADPTDASTTCRRCGGGLEHRADDDERVVRDRLLVYARESRPLADHYRGRATFRTVNGAQPPEWVARELGAAIADASRVGAGLSLGARR